LHGFLLLIGCKISIFKPVQATACGFRSGHKSGFCRAKALGLMTSILKMRETIYIVLIDVFIVFAIRVNGVVLLVFLVCVEKTRQINCFVLQCCT
jgi:hypothetical protein